MGKRAGSAQHGGRHERAQRLETTPNPAADECGLTKYLLHERGWGVVSAQKLQCIALLAYTDQCTLSRRLGLSEDLIPEDSTSLARLGNWGKQPGNFNAQLKTCLGEPEVPPQIKLAVPLLPSKQHRLDASSSVDSGGRMPLLWKTSQSCCRTLRFLGISTTTKAIP